ncbi:KAP family P-loop NTPase fold protein [Aerosakkonema funiforme]|uniref:KAP family P-loop NTPase fold protein n=1 Tax=Aerosakkonema funiforme TaxID=1246630 RepID=UPI0035BAD43D
MYFNEVDRNIIRGGPGSSSELNYDIYAELLCNMAIEATQPLSIQNQDRKEGAFTIGIFGSWGSGKTSLMARMKRDFEQLATPAKKYKTVWFNAWKYDDRLDIKNALIQTILSQIAEDTNIDSKERKNITKAALTYSVCAFKLAGILGRGYVNAQTAGFINTQAIAKQFEMLVNPDENPHLINPYQFINNFENVFKSAVQSYVGNEGRLMIFIDDLDRCLPENALSVLECLKLHLDQSNCIFVIGLDKRIIEQAVGQRYPKELGITGREYIEKIINLNFFLSDKDREEVKSRLLQGSLTAQYSNDEIIWGMISKATNSNIRKMQQFITAFYMIQKFVEKHNSTIVDKLAQPRLTDDHRSIIEKKKIDWNTDNKYKFCKIILLQLNFPEFYDRLANNHQIIDQIYTAWKTEGGTDDSIDSLIKSKNNYPIFAEFLEDRNLIDFLVTYYNDGKITNSDDWKVIQKLSQSVTYM